MSIGSRTYSLPGVAGVFTSPAAVAGQADETPAQFIAYTAEEKEALKAKEHQAQFQKQFQTFDSLLEKLKAFNPNHDAGQNRDAPAVRKELSPDDWQTPYSALPAFVKVTISGTQFEAAIDQSAENLVKEAKNCKIMIPGCRKDIESRILGYCKLDAVGIIDGERFKIVLQDNVEVLQLN